MSDTDYQDADLQNLDAPAEYDRIPVRTLGKDDLDAMVRIDKRRTGRSRRDYLEIKLREAMEDTRIVVSLGAEIDGNLVGFLMGRIYYGEFGTPEPVAFLDTIDVDPDRARGGVGRALMGQFKTNLNALGIGAIRTHADWNDWPLLGFLSKSGFAPMPRVTLEARIDN